MNSRILSLVAVLMISMFLSAQAQTFEKLWKDVEAMEKKDLPKSVVKLTEAIYEKALKERNTPEMMKAYLLGMQYRERITPDSFYVDVKGLENWAAETKEPLDAAVLHSVLGEIYGNYLSNYRFARPTATAITDVPDDMKEWSRNVFVRKSFEHFKLSLVDIELLGKTSVDAFRPVVVKGDASKYFHHDMLHMLGMRAVSSLTSNAWMAEQDYPQTPKSVKVSYWGLDAFLNTSLPQASEYDYLSESFRIYQTMLGYYKAKGDAPAGLLTDLDRVDFINSYLVNNSYDPSVKEVKELLAGPFYKELEAMLAQYASTEVCAEVYIKMAEYANQNRQPAEALRLAREGIDKYPRYERINVLKNIVNDVQNPQLNGRFEETVYPDKQFNVIVNYRNLSGFTLKIYRVNLPADSDKLGAYKERSFRSSYAKLVESKYLALKPTPDYLNVDTTLNVTAPGEGIYLIEIQPDAKSTASDLGLLYVTKMKIVNRRLPDNQYEFVVVDAQSGQPVAQADLILYKQVKGQYQRLKTLLTNEEGTATTPYDKSYGFLLARKGSDTSMKPASLGYNYYRDPKAPGKNTVLNLFTDRSIYRPGQTVFVAGIAYEQDRSSASVLADQEYNLQLFDVNNKVIAEKKVKTNEFGSFSGEFILPSPTLTGRFWLRVGDTGTSIQVEEYKRPTFDVSFLPQEGTYSMGDSVTVKGIAKTFSGVPLQSSIVKYTVQRRVPMFWRWVPGSPKALASGEVTTGEKGDFSIKIYLEPDQDMKGLPAWYSTYVIEATITDVAGETQSGVINLPVGSTSLILSSDLPKEIQKEKMDEVTFSAKNLNQQPVKVTGEYAIWQLIGSGEDVKPGNCLVNAHFTANEAFKLTTLKDLSSGAYRLILTAKDEQGREVKSESDFILFSITDKKPPIQTVNWFYQLDNEFSPEKPATLLFGTSEKNVYVLYDVFCDNKRLESKRIQLSDSIMKMTFPYQDAYGDGLLVQLAFVKEGKFYQDEARITKAQPDKKLSMKWEVFRDKLKPGQEEEWKLSIRYPDGKPAEAELLATMYDASLDKILGHDWGLNVYFPRVLPYSRWNESYLRLSYFYLDFPLKFLNYKGLSYDNLISYMGQPIFLTAGGVRNKSYSTAEHSGVAVKSLARQAATGDMILVAENDVFEEEMAPVAMEYAEGKADVASSNDVQLRENFAETAFFYPQLRTNAQGEISFSFTLPESLTEWKFMGLSHSKNMDNAKLTAKAVASKDFMLSPNLPRFVRVGDETSIAASIINLSSQDVSGTVRMELFNPETGKVFYSQKQKFAVKAGKTEGTSFTFKVDEGVRLMACRMIADGGAFSDGEQQYIPVLSNKEWITESLPIAVTGAETKTYSLENLFNKNSKSATERRLTVEFTGNPAWYAVQALPSLSNPTTENAISWIAAYYANNVSSYLVHANPRIKALFDSWKAQGGTKETLWSNLQKNQDLKNILLNESPWLAEATNEAEQKQRIALLFDLNTIQNSNAVAVSKLQSLQLPDGSWTWYKGMDGSRYITQFVVEALGRMQILTGNSLPQDVQNMYENAFSYLNEQALAEYKAMKKAEKEGAKDLHPSELTVHYLYICALTDVKLPEVNRQAADYFISKLPGTIRQQTIYGKAVSAIILDKAGKKTAANDFMASLQEYAVDTKDMGMYYDTKTAFYSLYSYKIPTQVAVIEAMELVSKNSAAVEQLKIWLLKQKQTQSWDSPLATVNAVYALLNRGTDLLDSKGDVKITLGNKVIETNSPSGSEVPGLGYVKETFTGKEITSGMKNLKVEKQDAGIAWGAVYAQYLENIDQVGKQGESLSVDKKLYVERIQEGRSQLVPLSEAGELKIGDKVVARLTIKSDRDIDFVQLKDQRGACFEPLATLSGYRFQNGIGYYVAVKDASTEFFFDGLRKGTYILEHSFYVARSGNYTSGIATLQSAYAPEFSGHSAAVRVVVE